MKNWPNFKYEEFACKHTGENKMDPTDLKAIQQKSTKKNQAHTPKA